jgi:hypothetical protein
MRAKLTDRLKSTGAFLTPPLGQIRLEVEEVLNEPFPAKINHDYFRKSKYCYNFAACFEPLNHYFQVIKHTS